jgi:RHS repeat-associated protein
MREESGTAPGLSALPSGGGGISALGDRFQPDLVRGSGSYAVSIDCPRGPNELQPSLTLSYCTGSGNGLFGLGWRLNVMRIERRSDRGVPKYTDDDTFVLGDAEVLVPVGSDRYRPKSDTKFWKIERDGDSWKIQMGDGKTMRFGQAPASRETDGARIFAWYLDEERDAAGNPILYSYRRDQNRLYLDEVQYSVFRIRFSYEARGDSIRNGRSGFSRVTALRCSAVELHCDRLAPTLMRSYTLTYAQAQNGASLLVRFSLSATDGIVSASAPELTFDYSDADFADSRVHEVESLIAPPSLDNPATQLVDMTGDGLPDVLQSFGSRMLLWHNGGNGSLAGPAVLDGVPSTVSLDRRNVAFADLDGDGRVDLFAVDQPLQLAFTSNGRGGFDPDPVVFRNRPNLRLAAPDTRLMDIDGDGVTDLISAGRNYFLLFRHLAGQGWNEPIPVPRVLDLDRFPDVSFEDLGVQLADMTGDGLQDFVAVRSGDVSYWPYFGNGEWGNRVEMLHPPQFPPDYRDDRLVVIDVDGDCCSDIVYFDHDRTLIWLNQSGVSFAAPIESPVAPNRASSRIRPADFFGDGRVGFLWSAPASVANSAGYRFLRFDEGHKPYLLTAIRNGMGRETTIEYATTTVMRVHDEDAGEDWQGQLPFVVPVVSAIRDKDSVSGTETHVAIRYHDGVYDGPQREFRGLMRTTVEMAGDESIPTLRQEYRFFQGDPDEQDLVELERQRAVAGSSQSLRTFEQTAGGFALRHESMQTWDARAEFDDTKHRVFFPFLVEIENREHSPAASPQRIERTQFLDYDTHGNAGKRIREFSVEGDPPARAIRSEERFFYTQDVALWLVKLPVRSELRDDAGVPFAVTIYTYDGPAFQGLPEGRADKGLLIRTQELLMLESRLPADYVAGRDFTILGYTLIGAGDTRGYYATKQAFKRDSRGNIIEQKDPMGASSQIAYDADGVFPIQRTDSLGKVTTIDFQYTSGEPHKVLLPDGRRMRFETDALGRMIAQFEADDAGVEQLVKCWRRDTASVPVTVTSFVPQGGGRTTAEFFSAANLTRLLQVYISHEYLDGFGKQILKITTAPDGAGGVRRFAASGQTESNARKMTKAEFAPSFVAGLGSIPTPSRATARLLHRYDAQGNLTETMGPGPAHFRLERDTFSLRHFEGSNAGGFGAPAPAGPASRTEFFDARDRVIRIEEAKGDGTNVSTSYDLTVDSRIAVIRDQGGNETVRYTFAGPGEAIRIAHRDAGVRTYYRDATGRIAELIRADGSRLFYRYDLSGRPVKIEHMPPPPAAASTAVREIFYDSDPGAPSAGRFLEERVALARESGNEIRYTYNRNGSVVREDVTVGASTLITLREYNLRQEVTAITYPDGHRIEYVLDGSGAVQRITGVVSQASYTAEGQIESYTCANGVQSIFARDPISNRLNQISAVRGGTSLRSISYAHDDVGNIIATHDEMPGSVEHQTFTYDGLHRLTHYEAHDNNAAGPIRRSEAYAYNGDGDILQLGPNMLGYSDAVRSGRVTDVTNGGIPQNILYTDRGQIRSWGGEFNDIEYDSLDRVAQVTRPDGVILRFAYDPQNRRILKQTIAGALTRNALYATHLYEKHDGQAIRHIYLGNSLIASETVAVAGTEPVFFLSDHHGTILLGSDAAGTVVQNQRYTPFGRALDAGLLLDRYLGIERDTEIGLIQLGARCYAPAIGRFISPDWYILENPTLPMHIPQGFNAYSYALNNPLVFRDPSGKWFFLIPFIVGFVAGLVYGLADGQKWDALGRRWKRA